MKNNLWHKRIPTLFALILIIVGIGVTTYLVGTGAVVTTKAGPSETPQNIRITNITDNSFSVSYTTEAEVVGSINYGKSETADQTTLDDRDENGNISPHFVHHITVKNLDPSTQYYFSITSGSKNFTQDGTLYKITTGSTLSKLGIDDRIIRGTVVYKEPSSQEAIVYISSENTNSISILARGDGDYSILLNTLRAKDLTSFFDFNEDTVFNMLVQGHDGASNVKFSIPSGDELPPVIISEDFDFTEELPIASGSAEEVFSSLNLEASIPGQTPQIITPGNDQDFVDDQPRFTGTAVADTTISIEIHSNENIKAQVTVDSRGNWTYRPPSSLSPGDHTITITARDSFGILRTLTRSFTILASGSQVSQVATPSATPVPTSIPVISSTPTPTTAVAPSTTISPTPLLTSTPSPTPTITPIPSPVDPPGTPLALLGIIGIGIAGFGIFTLFYNRNASI